MDFETFKLCCETSDKITPKPIKGVCLCFHGLGQTGFQGFYEQRNWADLGYLLVAPYYGPWSWMNRESRDFIDEVVEVVYKYYELDKSVPLLSTGGSMGGYSALLYTRYSKHPISACIAYFPVTDLKYHFTERPDVAKTVLHAFRSYKEDRELLFTEHSPLCQVENMPRIPYILLHGENDEAVNKKMHTDRLYSEMKNLGFNVKYFELKNYGHGGVRPLEVDLYIERFVKGFIE